MLLASRNLGLSRASNFLLLVRCARIVAVVGGLVTWLSASGCVGAEKNTPGASVTNSSNFNLRFKSEGGFGNQTVDITVRRDAQKPITVAVLTGNLAPVEHQYSFADSVGQKVEEILRSGVLDLKSENRKAERAGRDLPRVSIQYSSGGTQIMIIRDYRWGNRFERSFHQAEKLFAEIADRVTSPPLRQSSSRP